MASRAQPFSRPLTADALLVLAGPTFFDRGQKYAREGRVVEARARAGHLDGAVRGTRLYEVRLTEGEDGLATACDCECWDTHGICKHVVALGLHWLERGAGQLPAPVSAVDDGRPRAVPAVEAWLHEHHVEHVRRLPLEALAGFIAARELRILESFRQGRMGMVAALAGALDTDTRKQPVRAAAWARVDAELARVAAGLEVEAQRQGPRVPTDPRLAPLLDALERERAQVRERVWPRVLEADAVALDVSLRPPRVRYRERVLVLTSGSSTLPVPVEVELRPGALLAGGAAVRCTCLPGQPAARCVHALGALDALGDALCDPRHAARNARLAEALGGGGWSQVLDGLTRAAESGARAGSRSTLAAVSWRLTLSAGWPQLEPYAHHTRRGSAVMTRGAKLDPKDAPAALALLEGAPREREALELSLTTSSVAGLGTSGFLLVRQLRLLAGSPRLFLATRPDAPLAVEEHRLGLLVERGAEGGVDLAFTAGERTLSVGTVAGAERPYAPELPALLLEPDAPRLTLLHVPRELGPLLEALQDWGGHLPEEAVPALVDQLATLERTFPLVLPPGLEGEALAPSARQVLRLRPDAGGLHVALRAEPLPGVTPVVPGEGEPVLRAVQHGRRVVVTRALEAERQGARTRLGALELSAEAAHAEGLELSGDDALALVERLEALQDEALRVEWPEAAWRVSRAPSLTQVRVEVTQKTDWFGLAGGVEVDGEKLELAALLEAIRRGERYVALTRGRWVRITEALREQLGALAELASPTRAGLELTPAAAPALEALAREGLKVHAPPDWRALAGRVREAQGLRLKVPKGLSAELRDYQREGFEWMARLAHWGAGGVLADDMGLGKTLQTLTLLLHRAKAGPALVVAPTSVCSNWVREAARFTPSLRVHLYRESGREALVQAAGPGDVVVVSYGLLVQDAARFGVRTWATLVADEAQAVKNADTARARAVRSLTAGARVALTGTPVENRLTELWSLFALVFPGLLGSRERFREHFALPIERERDERRRAALSQLVRPFLLRRTKAEVARELPPRIELQVPVVLSAGERKLYEQARLAAVAELELAGKKERFELLAALTRLRLLACHPKLGDPGSHLPSAKLTRFLELVAELRAEGQRALVFSQFVRHLALVREALERAGVSYVYLDGATPAAERQARVDAFQRGEGELFLISLKAGGTGLNLTAAEHVIHLDPWWNPAVEDQATDRAHRIGQRRTVTVSRLIVEGTVEEAIVQLHARKRALADSLLSEADGAAALGPEQLLALLRHGGEAPAGVH